MTTTLAFDIYGTLIDTHGVIQTLSEMIGSERASVFSTAWRDKQLEYTFRRGLMGRYQTFANCTAQALSYCCRALDTPLAESQQQRLLQSYRSLPAYPDVSPALKQLSEGAYQLVAFSNGTADAVNGLLKHAKIDQYFSATVSVDEIKTFKPDPRVYQHLLQRCDSNATDTWLISGNPFDVMGAKSAGLKGAWLQRQAKAALDPWHEFEPDTIISGLKQLGPAIEASHKQ